MAWYLGQEALAGLHEEATGEIRQAASRRRTRLSANYGEELAMKKHVAQHTERSDQQKHHRQIDPSVQFVAKTTGRASGFRRDLAQYGIKKRPQT